MGLIFDAAVVRCREEARTSKLVDHQEVVGGPVAAVRFEFVMFDEGEMDATHWEVWEVIRFVHRVCVISVNQRFARGNVCAHFKCRSALIPHIARVTRVLVARCGRSGARATVCISVNYDSPAAVAIPSRGAISALPTP